MRMSSPPMVTSTLFMRYSLRGAASARLLLRVDIEGEGRSRGVLDHRPITVKHAASSPGRLRTSPVLRAAMKGKSRANPAAARDDAEFIESRGILRPLCCHIRSSAA
jgi:hypothetical protein